MTATIRSALEGATQRLADSETSRLDAELLLASTLQCDRAALVMRSDEELDPGALARYEGLVARRAAHEPVAYILGYKDFRHLRLRVDRRVLIPRPETELLVEVGLTLPHRARVVDVGTGSGAVALALKDEREDLEVSGTDVSVGALEVARANGVRLGLEVRFVLGDLIAGVPADAVLANLPYVATDGPPLPVDVSRYEPTKALFAGADGLHEIRRLVGRSGGLSLLVLEIAVNQGDAVTELVRGAGFGSVERLRDLAGHERVVVGRR
jgi:release factor glutamine methyltransferase